MNGKEDDRDRRFSRFAIELHAVHPEKVDKALVVQRRIFERTRVITPIDEILVQMGALTHQMRNDLLRLHQELAPEGSPPATLLRAQTGQRSAGRPGQGENTLEIRVSPDRLAALAEWHGPRPARTFAVEDVKHMLYAEGISHGVADDAQIQAFLNGQTNPGEPWTIATGTPPTPGVPATIVYHFDRDPLKIGTLKADGSMDWKDRGMLPQVKEGDLLAEIRPGMAGKAGMDVHGQPIGPPKVREVRLKSGPGARRSPDDSQVHAVATGLPALSLSGEITVTPILQIQGDIALKTGHVSFDGHIEVTGTIEKGYQVRGASLRAGAIGEAHLIIDGDLTATSGISGATIRAGGNLRAGHINNVDIIVAGDMVVEREIVESRIETNGRLLIQEGTVISSVISAKMGIVAMDVGKKASKPSELTVGIDRRLQREVEALQGNLRTITTVRDILSKRLDNLKKRVDEINTRLGVVAQQQDRCMVQLRELQERIDTPSTNRDPAKNEDLRQTVAELKIRQAAFDQDVAWLLEEDEAIEGEVAAAKKALGESAEVLDRLNRRLDELVAAQKASAGVATVQVAGTVFSGTRVSGPNSTLLLQEDFSRLVMAETDRPDHEGIKRWRFELNPG